MQNLLRRLLFQYWYFGQPKWDTGISPPELLDFIEKHTPARAIDIGCGTGTNVITLARAGWQVTGVDFAPRAIRLAKQKLESNRTQADLRVGDATNLKSVNGPYELALDIGCFHSVQKHGKAKYLKQLIRILAPNGFWLMYGFFKPDPNHAGTGLVQADLDMISSQLTLISRRDGFDDKRNRSSAWFLYQKC
ncbi:MAG: methyltransferase domain-containing protein [Anaerolineae bacterium]|nr:methyltransferase domain-containing protein [Anaerolineae bacterium]MCI0611228.1 methyltransferase domain-containing protein [Anaerolineae bacterium]